MSPTLYRSLLPLLLGLALAAPAQADDALTVGVYAGPGADADDRQALTKLVSEGGLEARAVERASDDALRGLDVLLVGGGSGTSLARGLGGDGARAVAEFVERGGGYVGVGAGAYLGARGYNDATGVLELLDAKVVDPANWKRGEGLVTLAGAPFGCAAPEWRFKNGPLFAPGGAEGWAAYEAVARFESDIARDDAERAGAMPGADAIVRGPFGAGRVVLFSVLAHERPATAPALAAALRWAADDSGEVAPAPGIAAKRPAPAAAAPAEEAPEGSIKVAVLDDAGCIGSCVRGAIAALDGAGGRFWVRRVDGPAVAGGALDGFDVFVSPGGSATKQSNALGEAGRARLVRFVRGGGGYVGVCAGAYLAATEPRRYGLGLAAVRVVDTQHWKRGEGLVRLEGLEALPQVTGRAAGELLMVYANGPLLEPMEVPGLPAVTPLARFVSDIHQNGAPAGMMPGKLASLAVEAGKGRLVLFSTHPELTPGFGDMFARAALWTAKQGAVK